MKILITDDDLELCQLLKEYLEHEGMSVSLSHDGQSAIETLQQESFDILILDVMMPHLNGFETLSSIRKNNQIPVIMLTAKGEKIDRIVGLEMGADDYVSKPCDPRELVARIRAIARRTVHQQPVASQVESTKLDGLTLSHTTRTVEIGKKDIELTSTEFDFLELLVRQAGSIVSREKLSADVLGKRLQSFDRSIDMHISNLRKKLGKRTDGLERIKTVRSNGYQFLK